MPRPIIIDTDPGIDDAVAILLALASPELEVLGLVAVAGNLPLATTARNALSIVELAGRRELPVYAGCPRPLGRPLIDVESAHGASGLGDLVLPPPAAMLRPEHGILYLIDRWRRRRRAARPAPSPGQAANGDARPLCHRLSPGPGAVPLARGQCRDRNRKPARDRLDPDRLARAQPAQAQRPGHRSGRCRWGLS